MNVYLDESGDLGFSLDSPYRDGGSSRYLTIAAFFCPKDLSYYPKRLVKKIYRQKNKNTDREIKGKDLSINDKIAIAEKARNMLLKNPSMKIVAITVNKNAVMDHIREDPNKLYNYMIGLMLLPKIKDMARVTIIPDKRSLKVESGHSLIDYLKIELWLKLNSKTKVGFAPIESHACRNIVFIDWICHIVWKSYEDGELEAINKIRGQIETKSLFF